MYWNILICVLYLILEVQSMALQGPPVTRYDPCGLGVIHLDKTTNTTWTGVIYFGLYPDLTTTATEINFKVSVRNAWASQSNTIYLKDNTTLIIRPKEKIPKKYLFHLELENDFVPLIDKFIFNDEVICSDKIKKSQSISSFDVKKNDQKHHHICGRRSMEHTELVTTGAEARSGEWPWHVAIFIKYKDSNNTWYQCGGNIISRTAILTAGHCIYLGGGVVETHRVIIYAGTTNLSDIYAKDLLTLKVNEIVIHPSYNDSLATSDLAVIKVDPIKFTEYVQPICIWGPVYDKNQLFGQHATIVGFGQTENDTYSKILRSTHTMVQNDTTCKTYGPNLYPRLLNEFTFCAGYGPKMSINPRNGDSGGGLVLAVHQPDHQISWFLRGILSKCGMEEDEKFCNPSFYVVYTDVGPHYSWIFHHAGLEYRSNIVYSRHEKF